MNFGDLQTRLLERVDDDSSYYAAAEQKHALNFAQRLFCRISLAVERTTTFTLASGQAFYTISGSPISLTDFIVPLKLTVAGARVRPCTIADLDFLSSSWRSTAGTPDKYAQEGYDLFAITPQPANGTTVLALTYAAVPAPLVNSGDAPEIPEEHHQDLIDFAVWWMRAKEGGSEFQSTNELLNRFLDNAQKYAEFVRTRSKGQLYDRVPPDISKFDRSRFAFKLKQIALKKEAA
ncbi:MAG: hypothetical protein WBV94_09060 [Blastocatellia bacterium]